MEILDVSCQQPQCTTIESNTSTRDMFFQHSKVELYLKTKQKKNKKQPFLTLAEFHFSEDKKRSEVNLS